LGLVTNSQYHRIYIDKVNKDITLCHAEKYPVHQTGRTNKKTCQGQHYYDYEQNLLALLISRTKFDTKSQPYGVIIANHEIERF